MLTWGRAMPEKARTICRQGRRHTALSAEVHGAQGSSEETLGTGVGEHFNLPEHELAHFNFLPFEKVRSSDPFVIEARESYWIEKYGVLGEGGMNRRS